LRWRVPHEVDFLVKEARDVMEQHFIIVELGDREVGLVFKNGKVAGVLAPGKRQLYWRGAIEVRVERQDISKEFELPTSLAKVLGGPSCRSPRRWRTLSTRSRCPIPRSVC